MPYLGEIFALSASALWSVSSFVFTSISIKIGTVQLNIWRLVSASVLLGITILIAGISLDLTAYQYLMLSISGIIGLVWGDTFLFKAFKEIGPRISMLMMSINPGIAALFAFFFP